MARTTTTRCRWSSPKARAPGSPTPKGNRYLDWLAAYSAVNFGHRHPRLVAAAKAQLDRLTLASRAFHTDALGPFLSGLAELCGKDAVLPMNTGAEAVETAIKAARKWGYTRKGVAPGQGPDRRVRRELPRPHHHDRRLLLRPRLPRGLRALRRRLRLRPLRRHRGPARRHRPRHGRGAHRTRPGRGRRRRPAPGVPARGPRGLRRERRADDRRRDPVRPRPHRPHLRLRQGARGPRRLPARQGPRRRHRPRLGGLADREVMDVFTPGTHGSTFGGNPLAAAVGTEVVAMLATGEWQARATELGKHLEGALAGLEGAESIRVCGLWAGVDLAADGPTAREVCERAAGSACCARRPTTARCASHRRWSSNPTRSTAASRSSNRRSAATDRT